MNPEQVDKIAVMIADIKAKCDKIKNTKPVPKIPEPKEEKKI